jgi:hypothetical protein
MIARFVNASRSRALEQGRTPKRLSRIGLFVLLFLVLAVATLARERVVGNKADSFYRFGPIPTSI